MFFKYIFRVSVGYYLLSEKLRMFELEIKFFWFLDLVILIWEKLGHIIGLVRTGRKHWKS